MQHVHNVTRTVLLIFLLAGLALGQIRSAQRVNTAGFNPGNNAHGIGVATGGSRFVVVWSEQNGTATTTQDIFASVSNDEGLTWSPMVRVDTGDAPNATDSDEPKVVITADETIIVVWEDKRDANANSSSNEDVFYNRSVDGGQTWMPQSLPLNTTTAGANVASDIDRISVATTGNTIHVVWEQDSVSCIGCAEELWYTRSNDAGATWTVPVIINTIVPGNTNGNPPWPNNDVDDPEIAASGQNVVIAFIDDQNQIAGLNQDDAYVLSSQDGGNTWTQIPVDSTNAGDAGEPHSAIDGNLAVVIWEDRELGTDAIHASVSLDGGITWSPEFTVSVAQSGVAGSQAFRGEVAVNGTNIYIVYCDNSVAVLAGGSGASTQNGKAYVSVSNDSGASFIFDMPLDAMNPQRPNHRTAVAATSELVYVHMETGTNGNNQVAYAWSRDFGLTWNEAVPVANTGPDTDTEDENEGVFFAANPVNHVAVSAFHDRPLGQNEVYAAGVRAPFLALDGTPTLGTNVNFAVRGVPLLSTPGATFLTGVSSTGTAPPLPVPGGLLIHLQIDPLTLILLADPLFLPLISGPVAGTGEGLGASFVWPTGPGVTFFCDALVLDATGTIALVTDPLTIVSQ